MENALNFELIGDLVTDYLLVYDKSYSLVYLNDKSKELFSEKEAKNLINIFHSQETYKIDKIIKNKSSIIQNLNLSNKKFQFPFEFKFKFTKDYIFVYFKESSIFSHFAYDFKEIQESSKMGLWELDLKTNQTAWSDQTYKIHEIPIGTPTNKFNGISFYTESDQKIIADLVERCASEGIPFEKDLQIITANKNRIWVRATGRPIFNENGKIELLKGTFQDINDEKLKELDLIYNLQFQKIQNRISDISQQEWSLERKLESSITAILSLEWLPKDSEAVFVLRNNKIEIVGQSIKIREELNNQSYLSSWSNSFIDKKEKIIQNKEDEIYHIFPIKDIDLTIAQLIIYSKIINDDFDKKKVDILKVKKIEKSISDLITRHNIKKEFKKQSIDYKTLLEETKFILSSMKTGVWKWDLISDHITWDDTQYSIHDLNKEDFNHAYEAWESCLHPEEKTRCNQEVEDALSGKKDFNTIYKIYDKNKEIRYIGAKGVVKKDTSGKPIEMYGVNWDCTKEMISKEKLKEQENLALHKSKMASIGELAAGVGHEINNPLAVIKGYAKNIEKITDDDNIIKNIEKITLASERIEKISLGLRNFSRKGEDFEEFDIVNLVDESYDMLEDIYRKDNIKLSFENLTENDFYFNTLGNRGKIQQVIINLLSNAKDAVLEKKDSLEKFIKIKVWNKYENLVISIEDNGIGMSEDVKNKIFEPFFTTKKTNKGTGIGLALSANIIDQHRGKLGIQTKVNKGSIFTLTFPVNKVLKSNVIESKSVEEKKLNNMTALVVDDEIDLIDIMEIYLSDIGIKIKGFTDPKEALDYALNNSSNFDLVISDLHMPNVDGIEFLNKIKESLMDKKCILSTGALNDEELLSENSFIDGVISKPFNESQINDLIKEIFPKKAV